MSRLKRRPELKSGIQEIRPDAGRDPFKAQRARIENDICRLLLELEEAQRGCRDKGAAAELLGDTLTSKRWDRYKSNPEQILAGLETKKTA